MLCEASFSCQTGTRLQDSQYQGYQTLISISESLEKCILSFTLFSSKGQLPVSHPTVLGESHVTNRLVLVWGLVTY